MCGLFSNERPPFVKTFGQGWGRLRGASLKCQMNTFLLRGRGAVFVMSKIVKQFLSAKYEVFYINPAYLLLVVIF